MGLLDIFFKKAGRVAVKGNTLLNLSYESDTLKNIDNLIKTLNEIKGSLIHFNNVNFDKEHINKFDLVKFNSNINDFNKLINKEKLRIKRSGLFLSKQLDKDELNLTNNYLEKLNHSNLSSDISTSNLEKIENLIKSYSFFQKRLTVYLSKLD